MNHRRSQHLARARRVLSIAFASPLLLSAASGHDWPQWRGPARDGISRESGWSAAGAEESSWERDVGLGYSTVSIVKGRLYTEGFDEAGGKDVLWCLDAATGAVLWSHSYPSRIWNEMHGGGTLATPSVDGEDVYVLNREGRFLRLDAESGEVRWERDLCKELDLKPPRWGFSASPLVLEEAIVLNLGTVLALDKQTGKPIWRTGKSYGDAYSTPVDFVLGEKRALAVFAGEGLAILSRAEGAELAFHPWKTKYDINAATPVVSQQRVFISSGLDRGAALIDLAGEEPRVVWESKVMRNRMSGCVLWGEHLYGFDESVLKCIDLDGNERWRARGLGDGALVAADGRLICVSSRGELVVAEASPEEYRELSRAKALEGGVFWTTPVLSDGRIYLRSSLGRLVCRDHRK